MAFQQKTRIGKIELAIMAALWETWKGYDGPSFGMTLPGGADSEGKLTPDWIWYGYLCRQIIQTWSLYQGRVSPRQIGRQLRPSISRAIRNLNEYGLVELLEPNRDLRQHRVSYARLSEAGFEFMATKLNNSGGTGALDWEALIQYGVQETRKRDQHARP